MPSSKAAQQAILQLCDATGDGPIYELGSGWGNVLFELAKRYPNREVVGFELSFLPWLYSVVAAKLCGLKNVSLHRKDFFQADLNKAAVMVCYLFPKGMVRLSHKLETEAGQLKFLISNNFALPHHTLIKKIIAHDFYQSPIYLYRVN